MPYKDPQKQIENYRKLRTERRAAWIAANGPCAWCGSNEQLEVDHIDRTTKKYEIGTLWVRSFAVRYEELLKCQVLCRACHEFKTQSESRTMCEFHRKRRRKCTCNGY